MLVKLLLQVLRKNLRFGQYFRFCANYANKISQKRAKLIAQKHAKLIALHEQKMRKNSPKKTFKQKLRKFCAIKLSIRGNPISKGLYSPINYFPVN